MPALEYRCKQANRIRSDRRGVMIPAARSQGCNAYWQSVREHLSMHGNGRERQFQALSSRFTLGLARAYAQLLWCRGRFAFQGSAVPMRQGSSSIVGGLQKREQRLGGLLRGAHGLIREDEFAQFFMEISSMRLNGIFVEAGRSGIGLGIESRFAQACTRPEASAGYFM
jgi:hypothetical protein